MASFKVSIKQSVAKDLRRIPKKDVVRILQRIEVLAVEPRPPGAEKLSATAIGQVGFDRRRKSDPKMIETTIRKKSFRQRSDRDTVAA